VKIFEPAFYTQAFSQSPVGSPYIASEMLVFIYQTKRHYSPADRSLHIHCPENLKISVLKRSSLSEYYKTIPKLQTLIVLEYIRTFKLYYIYLHSQNTVLFMATFYKTNTEQKRRNITEKKVFISSFTWSAQALNGRSQMVVENSSFSPASYFVH
jgi:hypothetical protein